MPHHVTRALRFALLAMAIALVFEITIQTINVHVSILGLPIHAILFITTSALVVSIVLLRRENKSRSVLLRSELELRRLNRTLATLSGCNSVLVHATDEAQLLNQICEIVEQVGGYRLAWVG